MANSRSSQFPPYEGTEIISLQFSNSSNHASLSDQNTEVGKIWAATLKTYLDHPETGIVWWGIVHDAPNKAKLFIGRYSEAAQIRTVLTRMSRRLEEFSWSGSIRG